MKFRHHKHSLNYKQKTGAAPADPVFCLFKLSRLDSCQQDDADSMGIVVPGRQIVLIIIRRK